MCSRLAPTSAISSFIPKSIFNPNIFRPEIFKILERHQVSIFYFCPYQKFQLIFEKMDEINRNMKRIFKKLELIERKLGVINLKIMTLDEKVSVLSKDEKNENEEVQEEAGPSSFTCHICGHGGLLNKSEWIIINPNLIQV